MQENRALRTLSVIQSSFLPWFGYFGMMKISSNFIILDDVQFDKNGWRNRNRINRNGEYQWLTVPVRLGKTSGPRIRDVEIDYSQKWIPKILGSIESNYGRSPHYSYFANVIESAIKKKPITLHELNIELIFRISQELELDTKIEVSSQIETSSDPNQRLIDLTRHANCDQYLSGQAAHHYLDIERFSENKIKVLWYEFDEMSQYPQQSSQFLSKLSIIDLLMNIGSIQTGRFLNEVNRTKGI
jgi:hypothetical protein